MFKGVLFAGDPDVAMNLKNILQGFDIYVAVTEKEEDLHFAGQSEDFHFLILPFDKNFEELILSVSKSGISKAVLFYTRDAEIFTHPCYHDFRVALVVPDLSHGVSLLSTLLFLKTNFTDQKKASTKDEPTFIVKVKRKYRKILTNEIVYVESVGNYCKIQLPKESVMVRYALKDLLDDIQNDQLVRIHRKHAVNLHFLDDFNIPENSCKIDNFTLKIGRKYKKSLKKNIEKKRQVL